MAKHTISVTEQAGMVYFFVLLRRFFFLHSLGAAAHNSYRREPPKLFEKERFS